MLATNQGGATTVQPTADCSKIPSIAYGHVSSTTYFQQNNIIREAKVEFTCDPGYTIVNPSGLGSVYCTNGVWGSLPTCAGMSMRLKSVSNFHVSASPTCLLSQLSSALVNVKLVSGSFDSANGAVLTGGWIQLQCSDGFLYNSLSGPLNITCLSTGTWTQFPICSR